MKKIWYVNDIGNQASNYVQSKEKSVIKLNIMPHGNKYTGKLEISSIIKQVEKDFSGTICFYYNINGNRKLIAEEKLKAQNVKNGDMGKSILTLNLDTIEALKDKLEQAEIELLFDNGKYIASSNDKFLVELRKQKVSESKELENDKIQMAEEINKDEEIEVEEPKLEEQELEEPEFGKKVVQLGVLEEEELEFRPFIHNSFLLHGFYNYGHLIIEETKKGRRLGVPGNFYHREQMVANMFGFPVFVPIKKGLPYEIEGDVPNGTFGYFYTQV